MVDDSLSKPPFKLYIVGSGDPLDIPPALANIVEIRQNLNYTEYYDTMNKMDICIPAFAHNEYFDSQATSAVFLALECNVSKHFLTTLHYRWAHR